MKLRSITGVKNLKGKRVLVRVDANVPVVNGRVVDGPHGRVAQAAKGIAWLAKKGARVVVIAHLGRPNGKKKTGESLKPVAARLEQLLKKKVLFGKSEGLKNGQIALLENLRFDAGEEKNDKKFAADLAKLADIYVNDAFGVSHRTHASVEALAHLLPSYAGQLLVEEIKQLSKVTTKPKRPMVVVLGGAKLETKIGVLEKLAPKADRILIGGAIATTFFAALGKKVGKSFYEPQQVKAAKKILKKFGKKIVLQVDVRVVKNLKRDRLPRNLEVKTIGSGDIIVDIGQRSMRQFVRELRDAKTVVWNGPFGVCEVNEFCESTQWLARVMANLKAPVKVVGGGDTVPIVESLKITDRFTHVSTGGGAMLTFLSGEKLPGLESLIMK